MLQMKELIKPGVLGFYNSCEAIQIYLIDKRENPKKYINVYTIFRFIANHIMAAIIAVNSM